MKLFSSIHEASELHSRFNLANSWSNDYMLKEELSKHINEGKLSYIVEDDNYYILLMKDGFYRLYYHINNKERIPTFELKKPVVMEILYRGRKRYPSDEVMFWQKGGFSSHLGRDCYFAKRSSISTINLSFDKDEKTLVKPIMQDKDLQMTRQMITDHLDRFTADILTDEELKHFSHRNELFGIFANDDLAGILQAELKQSVYWLGHLVVGKEHRGKGFSSRLLQYYFQKGIKQGCRQFQLWVIDDNLPALSLYQKNGFNYFNRSTISLLKMNE